MASLARCMQSIGDDVPTAFGIVTSVKSIRLVSRALGPFGRSGILVLLSHRMPSIQPRPLPRKHFILIKRPFAIAAPSPIAMCDERPKSNEQPKPLTQIRNGPTRFTHSLQCRIFCACVNVSLRCICTIKCLIVSQNEYVRALFAQCGGTAKRFDDSLLMDDNSKNGRLSDDSRSARRRRSNEFPVTRPVPAIKVFDAIASEERSELTHFIILLN